ncbi:thioesterase [Veronia nyctiphanis]|uniref:Thioesterase n=1 Tax=Veronia nyctiphanis TaxID=1278244 RepID=A0A4Q0YNC8_9GAMM|nr:thioesterase family protein [Veronia nyctiphanis]RXJ71444.1 thioesterase [Veronia nyctiphanis]
MNLLFRLLWVVLWKARQGKQTGAFDTSYISFRAWPTDCDVYMHMTNSRYSSFNDLARTNLLAKIGVLPTLIKRNMKFYVNASEFTFIRGIQPLQKFTIEARLVGWDEKYLYVEHRFVSKKGLHCIAHARAVITTAKGQQVHLTELLSEKRYEEQPQLPEAVIAWKSLLEKKKESSVQSGAGTEARAC